MSIISKTPFFFSGELLCLSRGYSQCIRLLISNYFLFLKMKTMLLHGDSGIVVGTVVMNQANAVSVEDFHQFTEMWRTCSSLDGWILNWTILKRIKLICKLSMKIKLGIKTGLHNLVSLFNRADFVFVLLLLLLLLCKWYFLRICCVSVG